MVWVSFHDFNQSIAARGAPVAGLGRIGTFGSAQVALGSTEGNFGNIAISPSGQVSVTYQLPSSDFGPSEIFVHTDPDGLGPLGFSAASSVPTNVGGFRMITPNITAHGIDAEANLAYDKSNGVHRGRLYLSYTDAADPFADDLNIFVRFSDDNGRTWSAPVRANDVTTNSQFLPGLAVDPVTGALAVGWMDSRNSGAGANNTTSQYFLTASVNGGLSFLPSVQVSRGTSRVDTSGANVVGFGDFLSFDFFNNVIRPIWADNSATLGNNPNLPRFDVATAAVTLVGGPPAVPLPTPVPLPPGHTIVAAAGPGSPPVVRVIDVGGNTVQTQFFAYDSRFTGGVRVARADFTGDGIPDVVTGPGPGGGPHVRVFDGATGFALPSRIGSFLAYPVGFRGGVYVAAGDVNHDAVADVITGAGAGGGPEVRVFDGRTGALIRDFLAFAPTFRGGVTVAAGDVNGDGFADIVTGAGPGGAPQVIVFSGASGGILRSFFAYAPTFAGGVFVAAGDLDGDGRADIVTGAGPGGASHVRAFDGATGQTTLSFVAFTTFAGSSLFASDTTTTAGARVALADVNGDGRPDIVVSRGTGARPLVEVFNGLSGARLTTFAAFDPSFLGGLFVG
jgi:FG-GAP-like repeat/FG-GAP repeat